MALTPAPMRRMRLVVLDEDARKVAALLGRLGVMHLVQAHVDGVPTPLRRVNRNEDLERCRALLARVEALRDRLSLADLPDADHDGEPPLDRIEARVAEMEERLKPVLARREKAASESDRLQDEHARLSALTMITGPLGHVVDSPFLHLFIGSIPVADLPTVQEAARPDVLLLDFPAEHQRSRLIAITPRRGRFALDTLLRQNNFTPEELAGLPLGTPGELLPQIEKRIAEVRAQQEECSREMAALTAEFRGPVIEVHGHLKLELAVLEASANFAHTASACLIDGWVPAAATAEATRRALEVTGRRAVIQTLTPEEAGAPPDEVPILFGNNRFVRPFELLVTTYGLPRYRDVEPSLLVAASFLLMYGLMFGDVGHGALLALAGVVLWRCMKDEAMRDLGAIVTYAGIASVLCGFLYGSFFGVDIEALSVLAHVGGLHWEGPLSQPMYLLAAPILIGVAMVTIGMLANVVNRYRNGDRAGALLDRFGGMGLLFYWGAIAVGLSYFVFGGGTLLVVLAALFLAGPLLVLFLKEIVHHFRHPSKEEGLAMTAVNGGFEVMETLMAFLTNTVSFSRVGAFALAHGGLSLAVYTLADIVRESAGGTVWSACVIILGNVLILALEGLIVFVQCMRLEYYEFFSKFFEGGGKRYSPFRVG
jgi:V/A-type H+-transporting ATPase subunit I